MKSLNIERTDGRNVSATDRGAEADPDSMGKKVKAVSYQQSNFLLSLRQAMTALPLKLSDQIFQCGCRVTVWAGCELLPVSSTCY